MILSQWKNNDNREGEYLLSYDMDLKTVYLVRWFNGLYYYVSVNLPKYNIYKVVESRMNTHIHLSLRGYIDYVPGGLEYIKPPKFILGENLTKGHYYFYYEDVKRYYTFVKLMYLPDNLKPITTFNLDEEYNQIEPLSSSFDISSPDMLGDNPKFIEFYNYIKVL